MSMIEFEGKQYDLVRGTYNPIQVDDGSWSVVHVPLVGNNVQVIEEGLKQNFAKTMAVFHARQSQRR